MSEPNNFKSKFAVIPSFYNIADDATTIQMQRWQYYGDKGRLLIIEGSFESEEKFRLEVTKCDRADDHAAEGLPHEECRRHFWLAVRPRDLVNMAKEILEFYKE